jgi:N-acetylneuraminate synthase
MNSIKTIWPAVRIFRKYKIKYALLHCTNIYPTPPELVGLNCINILKKNFPDCVVGLSDHTTSNFTSLGAVALGAKIIERHFVDSKNSSGPDVTSSMDSKELKELILGSNIIYKSLQRKNKILLKEEIPTKKFAFSSVVSLKDILPGEKLSENNIWVKRPGTGEFLAKDFSKLIGRVVKKRILKDSFIDSNSLKNR